MRQHHWILSVLDDLETYAKLNDLPLVEDQIMAAKSTAKKEMILKAARAADKKPQESDGTVVPLRRCSSE